MVIGRDQRTVRLALSAVCILILCILLTAGLWPFCAPKNGAAWIKGNNGLQFGPHGIVVSTEGFHAATPGRDCSLEILLQPAKIKGNGTILAFDSSKDDKLPFDVEQRWEDVAIQGAGRDAAGMQSRMFLETNG